MTTYRFQSFPAVAKATFTCVECRRERRTKTFRAECTVNPFNRGDDGHVLTPAEVRQQSKDEVRHARDIFLAKPMCSACESEISYAGRRSLYEERKALLAEAA